MRRVFGSVKSAISPMLTFERFAKGEANTPAYKASVALANREDYALRAVHIIGEVGSGKTHLLQAAANRYWNQNPTHNVTYVTASEIQATWNEIPRTVARKTLRSVLLTPDLLALDDIDSLNIDRHGQTYISTIIQARINCLKSTIISSNRGVSQTTGRGFPSKTQHVLEVELKPPDYSTRVSIVRLRTNEEGWQFSESLIEHIASRVTGSVRSLEHTLAKIATTIIANGIDIKKANVARLIPLHSGAHSFSNFTPENIKRHVAFYFDIPTIQLEESPATKLIAHAKEIAIYLIRQHTNSSFARIAEITGNSNYGSVMRAFARASSMVALPIYQKQVSEIETMIRISGNVDPSSQDC